MTDSPIARLEQRLARVRATQAGIQGRIRGGCLGDLREIDRGAKLQRLSERMVELAVDEADILGEIEDRRNGRCRLDDLGKPGDVRIEIPAARIGLEAQGPRPPYRSGKTPDGARGPSPYRPYRKVAAPRRG